MGYIGMNLNGLQGDYTLEKLGESIRPLIGGLTAGLVVGILVLDIMLPLRLAGTLYVALAMISLCSPKRAFTLAVAAACTALIALDIRYSVDEIQQPLALAGRGLSLLAIWATAILALLRRRDQEDIKLLRSLLPLCATCKKIRDKKGVWHQLEQYLKANSELQFSRSLCPECRKKWVPGVSDYR
ncbi:MAG: hypothetical protein C4293_18020 [Nitrospiraceae bacterium]